MLSRSSMTIRQALTGSPPMAAVTTDSRPPLISLAASHTGISTSASSPAAWSASSSHRSACSDFPAPIGATSYAQLPLGYPDGRIAVIRHPGDHVVDAIRREQGGQADGSFHAGLGRGAGQRVRAG